MIRGHGILPGLLLLAAVSVAWAVDFPPLSGRVVDQVGLLSAQQQTELSGRLAAHEAASGDQVVVVVLASLDGLAIEDYGYQLGRHWGIGQQGRDNGVLLLVAPQDRKVRIEVGYGLEGKLTDAMAHRIIQRDILPAFRNGDMAGGVLDGARAIMTVLGDTTPLPREPRAVRDRQSPLPFVVLLAMLVLRLSFSPLASAVLGGVAGFVVGVTMIGGVLAGLALAAVFAIIALLLALGRGGGGDGGFGGGWGGWGGYSGGGGFSGGGFGGGGFSGGGGGFGGGGASGGW